MSVLLWFFVVLTSIKADFPLFIWGESCPKVTGAPNFVASKYLGVWYQLSALPFAFTKTSDRCTLANYTALPNGNIGVNNTGISESTGERYGAVGEASLIDGDTNAELDVQFFFEPNSKGTPNYFILDTNYDEYTYVWSCRSIYFAHVPQLWILNRQFNRPLEYIQQQTQNALEILKGFGYQSGDKVLKSMNVTRQTDCDYSLSQGKTKFL